MLTCPMLALLTASHVSNPVSPTQSQVATQCMKSHCLPGCSDDRALPLTKSAGAPCQPCVGWNKGVISLEFLPLLLCRAGL